MNTSTSAQMIISAGGGINIHMTSGESTNSFSGSFNQNKSQQIGQLFDDTYIYAVGVSYLFNLRDSLARNIYIAGFEFSRGISKNLNTNYLPYFGENLTIASYSPYIGIGFRPRLKARNLIIFFTAGVSYKKYKGEYKDNYANLDIQQSFNNVIFPRFGFGINYKPTPVLPLLFTAELGLEFGKVERSNILIKYKGDYLGEAYPTGQINIPDNTLLVKLSASYLINL
jgi:hypothetical protein